METTNAMEMKRMRKIKTEREAVRGVMLQKENGEKKMKSRN